MEEVIRFWSVFLILGIGSMPLTGYLFRIYHNKGYLFSKIIGLCSSAFLLWLLSSLHIMRFTAGNAWICCLIVAFFNWGILLFKRGSFQNLSAEKGLFMRFLWAELEFLILFLLFLYLSGNRIIGVETEKPMDYAFMTNLFRTEYFPPIDTWASGTGLNYYYFGQYLITFLTKISFVKTGYGYTLGMAVVPAFTFVLIDSMIRELMRRHSPEQNGFRYKNQAAGILSGIMTVFCGNMHYVVFGKLVPMFWDILQIPGERPSYWFASSTRYIGYVPFVESDRTISEFPCYSFLVGDLHAHVIDLMIVLTILGILSAWVLQKKDSNDIKETLLQPHLILIAFLIGICSMTNYWDFPIYYVVCGSVILLINVRKEKWKGLLRTAFQGIYMMILIYLTALPFMLSFDAMITGIAICTTHSLFYQLVILWGFPVVLWIAFAAVLFKEKKADQSDLFVLLCGLCAVGLVIVPEMIYVRDIYESGFPRANTMFKLTYQAFVLFGIAGGYITARFLFFSKRRTQKGIGIFGFAGICLTLGYFFASSSMWLGNYMEPGNFKTLDAGRYYEDNMSRDMGAVHWLMEHVDNGQPVVLEADGNSYTDYERVSVMTGLPTVLGWHTHEWLWKNGYEIIEERQEDVKNIYTSDSPTLVRQLLNQYQVSYIMIGTKEYEKFPDLNVPMLLSMGECVYQSGMEESAVMLIKVENYD